jgi:hypothetical protein
VLSAFWSVEIIDEVFSAETQLQHVGLLEPAQLSLRDRDFITAASETSESELVAVSKLE